MTPVEESNTQKEIEDLTKRFKALRTPEKRKLAEFLTDYNTLSSFSQSKAQIDRNDQWNLSFLFIPDSEKRYVADFSI